MDPNQAPKCNPGPQICTGTQTRTCRDDVHSAVCWAILFKCATNNFNQRRKGDLGGQNYSNREHEYIHRPNIVKTCFTCRRYTVKSHAWENQRHACYSTVQKTPQCPIAIPAIIAKGPQQEYYIDSDPRKPRFVLVPRTGLGTPWRASNANKPASSWPLKQGPKKWSKPGGLKGTYLDSIGAASHMSRGFVFGI